MTSTGAVNATIANFNNALTGTVVANGLVTFTGGVRVGKIIAGKAGYKRAALELGGNDPLIILDDLSDADLDKAAELAVAREQLGDAFIAVELDDECAKPDVGMPPHSVLTEHLIDAAGKRTALGTAVAQAASPIS